MVRWSDAPLLHAPNSTYLDSLSNDTDPYSISYGNSAIVSQHTVTAYAAMNLLGILLLLILILTIVIPKKKNRIQRDPCLINAFIVIILVNTLNLLYWAASGGTINDYEVSYLPHPTLCRIQAVLQAGSQAAQMAVVLAVVLRLWLKTICISRPWFDRFRGKYTLATLLAFPYVCLIVFMPKSIVMTKPDHQAILIPTPFYCSLIDLKIRQTYQIATGVIGILAFLLEIWTICLVTYHFRQTTRTFYQVHQSLSGIHGIQLETIARPTRLLRRSFFLRVSLFVIWTLLMIMATLYQAFDDEVTDPSSDLIFAVVGIFAFVCFASQADILRAWRIPTSRPEWNSWFTSQTSSQEPAMPSARNARTNRHRSIDSDSLNDNREALNLADFIGTSGPGVAHSHGQIHSHGRGAGHNVDLEHGFGHRHGHRHEQRHKHPGIETIPSGKGVHSGLDFEGGVSEEKEADVFYLEEETGRSRRHSHTVIDLEEAVDSEDVLPEELVVTLASDSRSRYS